MQNMGPELLSTNTRRNEVKWYVRGARWWLGMTSFRWPTPHPTIEAREMTRRSRLASWLILGLAASLVILLPLASSNITARFSFSLFAIGLVAAAVLNRRGYISATGTLLVALIVFAILGPTIASPIGLTMGLLPNYDALAVSVLVAATLLPRPAIFLVAFANTALIVADYLLEPHNSNITIDAKLYSSATIQAVSLLVRPIALELLIAVISYLWIRGTDQAIRRADRAEEVAYMRQREAEQKRELEEGVEQLLQVLVLWANGNTQARVPEMRDSLLWRVGHALNTFIGRLEQFTQAEVVLRHTQDEAVRLAAAIAEWLHGRAPIWPAPIGTPLDPVIATLRGAAPEPTGMESNFYADNWTPNSQPRSFPSRGPAPTSQPLPPNYPNNVPGSGNNPRPRNPTQPPERFWPPE